MAPSNPARVDAPREFYYGRASVSSPGTAVQLVSDRRPVKSGVTIRASSTNSSLIYIGDVNVTSSNGFILSAGQTLFMEIYDLLGIHIDADTGGDGVSFIAT